MRTQKGSKPVALLILSLAGLDRVCYQSQASAAFTPGRGLGPVLQEAGWDPGSVWKDVEITS